MIKTTEKTFSFAEFELDTATRRLLKNNQPLALNPKAFDLLAVLVKNHGQILSKDELLKSVWENSFVEENNLTVHVSALRKIFGEKKGEHQFIATVPGKGYKFVADVRTPPDKSVDIFEEPPAENYNRAGGFNQDAEITIESHSFSRILIEENIVEENEFPAEKIINPRPEPRRLESQKTASKISPIVIYSILGAILIFIFAVFLYRQTGQPAEMKQFSAAKLTSNGRVSNATLTPDGKYAVYSQKENEGESLWLRHIPTGSQTQVLPAKPVRFVGLAVSPDGNSIYATTFSANVADPQIWRVPLLGGAVEEIKNITTGAAISFSPDGKQIAFTESRSSMRETQLLIADTDGANKRLLARAADDSRSFPIFGASPVAWSPNGNEIACAVEEQTGGGMKAGILLVNANDSSERFVTSKRWDYIEHLAWVDAENIAFVAYTSEPWQGQIWSVSRATGEARQITKDLNSYAWLASANGNLLTVQNNSVSHVSVADFDEKNNQIQPREIFKESGFIDNVAFTANGAILYTSSESGKREIWRMNADGTNRSQLTVNANVTFGMSVSRADGAIVFCSTENGKHFLKISNADGKNIRSLTEGAEDVYPNFTPDGQSIIFQKGLNNKIVNLWRVSLTDKIPVQITKTHSIHPAISPDGTQTAYYFMDAEADGLWRIGLISSADGSVLGKLSLPKPVTERRMRWHPGGRFIGQILYEGENINLLLLPTSGGEWQTVSGLGKGDVNWFEWSPAGKQIVVSHTTETQDVVFLSR